MSTTTMSNALISEFREARAESRSEGRQVRWRSAIDGARRGLPNVEMSFVIFKH
jgi:hypothetical protein